MRSPGILCTILAGGLLAGCTTQTAGTATPAPDAHGSSQPETTSQGGPPDDGAPNVDDPLDASRFEDDPCLVLGATQSSDLNLGAAGKQVHATLGKACLWENKNTRGQVQISFHSDVPDGLSADYRAQEDGKWAYFEELPNVEGFPAIARDITDNRKNGSCPVVVGVSAELTFEVDLRLSEANIGEEDPCEVAAEVTGMAVQTMQQG